MYTDGHVDSMVGRRSWQSHGYSSCGGHKWRQHKLTLVSRFNTVVRLSVILDKLDVNAMLNSSIFLRPKLYLGLLWFVTVQQLYDIL